MSAEANGLRGLLMTSIPDLVNRRCRTGGIPAKPSGGLVLLYCGLELIRANFKSNELDTGGDPGDKFILLKLPEMGIVLDILASGLRPRAG